MGGTSSGTGHTAGKFRAYCPQRTAVLYFCIYDNDSQGVIENGRDKRERIPQKADLIRREIYGNL